MKTLTNESASSYGQGYGESFKPITGFALMQPQNDPRKCVYLTVAHSSLLNNIKRNALSLEIDNTLIHENSKSKIGRSLNEYVNI
jgi:hypothetical protein